MSPTTWTNTRQSWGSHESLLAWGDLEDDLLNRGDLEDDTIGESLPTRWDKRTPVSPTTWTKRTPI